jgi:hypothetical protein
MRMMLKKMLKENAEEDAEERKILSTGDNGLWSKMTIYSIGVARE